MLFTRHGALQASLLAILALVPALQGCCTSDQCLDSKSTADKDRVTAPRVKLDLVYNDSVSSDRRDRTDWKYVMLARPGKLTAQLHWDNGKARLDLDVFDVMGIRIQEGRAWGAGGLRAVAAIEEPGPYYVRVRAAGSGDESQYSLRVSFQADLSKGQSVCHGCRVSDRKCLGNNSYIICESLGPGCTAWTRTFPCPPEVLCRSGICDPCSAPCRENAQRCTGASTYAVCQMQAGAACPSWSEPRSCPSGQRCREDHCRPKGKAHSTRVEPPTPVPPPPTLAASTKCKIFSIYKYRGVWTLHLEIGDNARIKPGQIGTVLEGDSNKPLPGGEIKITKVTGRYAIATTSLQQLGKNKWVKIEAP